MNFGETFFRVEGGGEPIRLDHDGEFVFTMPAPPDDGRCIAGWGLLEHGYPDSARCQNRATMPDSLCLGCHIEFGPRLQ